MIYFSKIFKDLCTENQGKLPRKKKRQQKNRNFSILNLNALAKILNLEHHVAVFPRTFYLLANRNNLRDLL